MTREKSTDGMPEKIGSALGAVVIIGICGLFPFLVLHAMGVVR